jgi:hypothetical protein
MELDPGIHIGNTWFVLKTGCDNISAGSCCAQVLWMKQTLLDYGVKFKEIPLLCDNESVIKIANNSVQHSRTKHIDIRQRGYQD